MKNKLIFLSVILFLLLFSNTGHSQWLVDGGNIFYPYGNVSITNGNFSLSGDLVMDGNLDIYPRLGDYFRLIDNGSSFNFNFATSDFGEGGDDFGQIHFAASPEEGISMIHWSGNPLDGTKSKIHITETYGIDIEGNNSSIELKQSEIGLYPMSGTNNYLTFKEYDTDAGTFTLNVDGTGYGSDNIFSLNPEEGFFMRANGISISTGTYDNQIMINASGGKAQLQVYRDTVFIGSLSGSDSFVLVDNSEQKVEVVVGGDKAMDIVNDGTRVHYNFPAMPSDSTNLNTGDLYYNSSTGAVHRKF